MTRELGTQVARDRDPLRPQGKKIRVLGSINDYGQIGHMVKADVTIHLILMSPALYLRAFLGNCICAESLTSTTDTPNTL